MVRICAGLVIGLCLIAASLVPEWSLGATFAPGFRFVWLDHSFVPNVPFLLAPRLHTWVWLHVLVMDVGS